MTEQLKVNVSLEAHLEGCSPLKPCRICQGLSYARECLSAAQFRKFISILTREKQEKVARLPPSLPALKRPISLRASVTKLNLTKSLQKDLKQAGVTTVEELIRIFETAEKTNTGSWRTEKLASRGKVCVRRVHDELKRVGRPITIPGLFD